MTGAFAGANGDSLEVGNGTVGSPFGVGNFDYTVEKVEDSSAAVGDFSPEAGKKLVIVTATVKNVSKAEATFASNFVLPKLADENGEEARMLVVAKMSSTEGLPWAKVQPDKQVRFRIIFEIPAAVKPSVLTLKDVESGRSVEIKLN